MWKRVNYKSLITYIRFLQFLNSYKDHKWTINGNYLSTIKDNQEAQIKEN